MAGSRSRLGRSGERSLRVLFGEGALATRSDADLVRGFLEAHGEAAEAAFEAIAARHGPMVLGVCRRTLGDEHAAEDAFQAVFLILARKARSVQVDDSLGRWLHGVATRVARRAKNQAAREVPGASAADRSTDDPAVIALRAEVRQMVGQEVARLPRKYREAVALCHLDGLSHDRAAEALGLPVGTVRSRLSRARDLLRTRLTRRGLAPAALAAWLSEPQAEAAVSKALLESTVKLAAAGAKTAVPPAIAALACLATRSLLTAKVAAVGAVVVAVGCLAVAGRRGEEPPKQPIPNAAPEVKAPAAPAPSPSLADQFQRIIKEYDDAQQHTQTEAEKGKTDFERWKLYNKYQVDEAPFARRVVDLAAEHPKEPASRDALIWVIDKPHRSDHGPYGDEVARAVNLLVMHHADDAETARLGLNLDNVITRRRDAFLEGIYANAKGREAKGLARVALARYLEAKAPFVAVARLAKSSQVIMVQTYDDQGAMTKQTIPLSNEELGYRVQLRMFDPDAVRREAERLYEEVVSDYADIPYVTTRRRELERLLRKTPADPKERAEQEQLKEYLQTQKIPTLGEFASGRLDEMRNLVVGKPAPDFEGVGVDGKPVRLSDFRGKVVVLDFWFSTCGPCLREIPDQRKLTEAMKGRPFTFLGIVKDGQIDDARKVIDSEKISWPNVLAGGETITERYHIESFPSHVVIDAQGVIRAKGHLDPASVGPVVEKLVKEAEAGMKK
ncbi:MAG: sigma-70 family RNA polymerase sigma factor [Paludisphaera borealis]|uniref:sigma-70 family RNA polymerase sigma factor n=1 Tax=Paludisphaera borealis TaxID=1387353 RepID=UPI00284F2978|nr:sigma-70 family RNA polymerase sigma factor [Paludisphaera borealis]MDR3621240.1 sigma-70 family RNA polymerase sigma factor [Paludisphaera borealis]